MENIFDGTQNGWSVELLEEINIRQWLTDDEENIVFKIIVTINGEPTSKYYLCNLNNLQQTLSTIFFGCDINTRVLLNKTYVNLKYVGLDHFVLEYTDNLWQFFNTNPNDDINSEYSFGDQSISSRKRLSKRCFYLNTNEESVTISTTPVKIPSNAYNDYHLRNILPPINCSQIDSTYLLITNVENGIFKNNLDEESTTVNQSTISSVTPESINWLPKPSPNNSEEEYSDISPMTSPERGGRTRKYKKKLKKNNNSKKSKQSKNSKKQKKTKKIIKNKRKSKK
jgi:hypothetical protein